MADLREISQLARINPVLREIYREYESAKFEHSTMDSARRLSLRFRRFFEGGSRIILYTWVNMDEKMTPFLVRPAEYESVVLNFFYKGDLSDLSTMKLYFRMAR